MQFFTMVNRLLVANPDTCKQELFVRTYSVDAAERQLRHCELGGPPRHDPRADQDVPACASTRTRRRSWD